MDIFTVQMMLWFAAMTCACIGEREKVLVRIRRIR